MWNLTQILIDERLKFIRFNKFNTDMRYISDDEYPQIEGLLEAGCVLQTRRTLVWTNSEPKPETTLIT